jgi:hypothetical protein
VIPSNSGARFGFALIGGVGFNVEHHITGCVSDKSIWVGGAVIEQLHNFAHCVLVPLARSLASLPIGKQHMGAAELLVSSFYSSRPCAQ